MTRAPRPASRSTTDEGLASAKLGGRRRSVDPERRTADVDVPSERQRVQKALDQRAVLQATVHELSQSLRPRAEHVDDRLFSRREFEARQLCIAVEPQRGRTETCERALHATELSVTSDTSPQERERRNACNLGSAPALQKVGAGVVAVSSLRRQREHPQDLPGHLLRQCGGEHLVRDQPAGKQHLAMELALFRHWNEGAIVRSVVDRPHLQQQTPEIDHRLGGLDFRWCPVCEQHRAPATRRRFQHQRAVQLPVERIHQEVRQRRAFERSSSCRRRRAHRGSRA